MSRHNLRLLTRLVTVTVAAALLAAGLVGPVLAHDCSSVPDCAQTAGWNVTVATGSAVAAAVAAAAGVIAGAGAAVAGGIGGAAGGAAGAGAVTQPPPAPAGAAGGAAGATGATATGGTAPPAPSGPVMEDVVIGGEEALDLLRTRGRTVNVNGVDLPVMPRSGNLPGGYSGAFDTQTVRLPDGTQVEVITDAAISDRRPVATGRVIERTGQDAIDDLTGPYNQPIEAADGGTYLPPPVNVPDDVRVAAHGTRWVVPRDPGALPADAVTRLNPDTGMVEVEVIDPNNVITQRVGAPPPAPGGSPAAGGAVAAGAGAAAAGAAAGTRPGSAGPAGQPGQAQDGANQAGGQAGTGDGSGTAPAAAGGVQAGDVPQPADAAAGAGAGAGTQPGEGGASAGTQTPGGEGGTGTPGTDSGDTAGRVEGTEGQDEGGDEPATEPPAEPPEIPTGEGPDEPPPGHAGTATRQPRTLDDVRRSLTQPGTTVVDPKDLGLVTPDGKLKVPDDVKDEAGLFEQVAITLVDGSPVTFDGGQVRIDTGAAPITGQVEVNAEGLLDARAEGLPDFLNDQASQMLDDWNKRINNAGLRVTSVEIRGGRVSITTELRL